MRWALLLCFPSRGRFFAVASDPFHGEGSGVNERPTARSGLGQQTGTRLIGRASPTELSQKLAALNDLTAPRLRAEWRRLYRGQPPRLSRDLLVRSIAYRIQELAHGGLSKATRRKLLALTKVLRSNGSIEPDDGPNLRPGARLVREWRDRTHTVQVTEDGFEYDGKPYSSLSKIAHVITGAHWSGPRFFGLSRKPTAGPQDSPVLLIAGTTVSCRSSGCLRSNAGASLDRAGATDALEPRPLQ